MPAQSDRRAANNDYPIHFDSDEELSAHRAKWSDDFIYLFELSASEEEIVLRIRQYLDSATRRIRTASEGRVSPFSGIGRVAAPDPSSSQYPGLCVQSSGPVRFDGQVRRAMAPAQTMTLRRIRTLCVECRIPRVRQLSIVSPRTAHAERLLPGFI